MSTAQKLKENIAEICFAAGGIGMRGRDVEDSRDTMDRLIAAAEALTDFEAKKRNLWDDYDWMLTCDNLAGAVMVGGRSITRASDVESYLADY
jgi:hypothetical protein